MGKLFANPIPISGLSRAKILSVGCALLIILLIIILWGIYYNDEDQPLNKEQPVVLHKPNDMSVDQVIDKITHVNASRANGSTLSIISSSPVLRNNNFESTRLVDVPPIVDNDTKVFKQHILQTKHRFELQQLDNQYSSIKSKTLLFSSMPANVAIVRNSSDVAASSAEDGLLRSNPSKLNNLIESVPLRNATIDKSLLNGAYLDENIIEPISPYELKAGSIIPATMINGINSDLPGQVVAQVRENIYNSTTRKYLLIPQGAKLVGVYDSHVLYGQERILVAWNRLIYPNGSSINLKAMPGTDLEGYAGFSDEVDNKYWKLFGTSFIMGVITAGMQYSQNNTNANVQSGGLGVTTNTNPSFGQTLSGSLGQQLGQTGLMVTQKNLNVQPTLIVKPGYPFNIIITADLVLRPYTYSI
ncbi:MAG: hypothetical protein KBD37_03515 [Burkholderiales bacterium]|nr:hypothetical protein [Burkholderiales bacterium]